MAPVAALAADVVCQIACLRLGYVGGLLRSLFAGFGAGALVVLLLTLGALRLDPAPAADAAARVFLNLLTYAALSYCYFHFVNLGETARRVRLLRELIEAGGSLTERDILCRYNARDMLHARLNRLLCNRQVVERSGRYVVGRPTVLVMSRAVLFMKRLVLRRERE